MMTSLWPRGLARHLRRHPGDLVVLARAGWRLRRRGWWHQVPFLPLPDPAYWSFRLSTVNGSNNVPVTPGAMVDAAKWSVHQRVGK
ncbi:MAG TPA: hypothetical protein VMV96_04715 [Acidimicrobiales bacterium]|nr:hypothetical protein [Acidimicrobiales bacterium]